MGNDKEIIKELEKIFNKSIPIANEIRGWYDEVKYENDNVIGLGLYQSEHLPEIIGELKNLQVLKLCRNYLNSLPESLGELKNLRILHLRYNNLRSLPESFGRLESLQDLDLSQNELLCRSETFWIPESLKSLTTLKLTKNKIINLPDSLFGLINLENLQTLELEDNGLSSLPQSFKNLKNLQTLNLKENRFESFPENLVNLKNLKVLDLSLTKLETLPETFGNLTNLQSLNLSYNRFKTLPEIIFQLKNLQVLDLSNNRLETLPEDFGNLTNLQDLNLTNKTLKNLPERFGNLLNIKKLIINRSQLSSLPETFGQLKNLEYLILNDNQLSSLPETFGQLKNLQLLSLYRIKLKSLPTNFVQLKNLKTLYLEDNQLETLPEDFGNLKNLKYVSLKNNRLNSLPKSIENLLSLKIFVFIDNPVYSQESKDTLEIIEKLKNRGVLTKGILCPKCHVIFPIPFVQSPDVFTGKWMKCYNCQKSFRYEKSKVVAEEHEIWEWLEGWLGELLMTDSKSQSPYIQIKNGHIISLWLTNCNLKYIPESFEKLEHLKTLVLSKNKLSSVPKSLQNLKSLQTLNLEYNQLSKLPAFLWPLKSLSNLKFIGNRLSPEEENIAKKNTEYILDYLRRKAAIRVFLSHAVIDYEKYHIKELSEYLEQQNEIDQAYYCEADLTGSIDDFMNDKVPDSQLLLFFASQKSVFNSVDCAHELDLARQYGIQIIPIKGKDINWEDLRKINLSRQLGFEYNEENYDNFKEDLFQYIIKFKEEIDLYNPAKARIDRLIKIFKNSMEKFADTEDFSKFISDNMKKMEELFDILSFGKISLKEFYIKMAKHISKIK